MATKNGDTTTHLPPRIIGVKVKNDHLRILFQDKAIRHGKEIVNEAGINFRYEPHPNLKKCVDEITPHIAILTDQEGSANFENWSEKKMAEIQRRYVLRSMKITRKDGEQSWRGVTLGGYRILATKKVMNFTAPLVRFQTEGEGYEYADHLEEQVDRLITELEAYIGGKYAAEGQITMGFESAEPEPQEGGEDGDGEEKE